MPNNIFKIVKYELPDGVYNAVIADCCIKNDRIQLEFILSENENYFVPATLSCRLHDKHPLYKFFKSMDLTDSDIMNVDINDYIDICVTIRVQNEQGDSKSFCNIKEITPVFESEE